MYKNYEDKLNTILSNAKGEKLEKVEFNIADKVLSDVSANGKSRSKYRQLIRQVRTDLAAALGHLENIKKRDERIEKNSKSFKRQADQLGIEKELKPPLSYVYEGLYIDKQLENDIQANKQAIKAVLKSSEI